MLERTQFVTARKSLTNILYKKSENWELSKCACALNFSVHAEVLDTITETTSQKIAIVNVICRP